MPILGIHVIFRGCIPFGGVGGVELCIAPRIIGPSLRVLGSVMFILVQNAFIPGDSIRELVIPWSEVTFTTLEFQSLINIQRRSHRIARN